MTAPTLPEPRPDDEGRERWLRDLAREMGRRAGEVPLGDSFRGGSLHDASVYGAWQFAIARVKESAIALTPHPAPLGATRSMTPEEVESQKAFRRAVSRPLGATDEGRDAVDRLCECGHPESGHVEPGWWTGSDIACVVCYDGQGGNPAVPPCKRFRAALQAGG